MSLSTTAAVVVGVDGTESGMKAVRFAAAEAERRGAALHVVHVSPSYVPMPPVRPAEPAWLTETGHTMLRRAAEEARQAVPGLTVNTYLVTGACTRSLVRAASDASLLVLGAPDRTTREKIWTGATDASVAARATCPVIVVPADWEPGPARGRVVVGYKSARHSHALLAAGFEAAARLGVDLHVLHAWRLPAAYDDIIANRADREAWRERVLATLTPLMAEPRREYPLVPVHVEVEHADPAQALIFACRDADLVLLARPVHGAVFGHLGHTARAVLRSPGCPIEVLPVKDAAGAADEELAAEEAALLV